MKVLDLSIVAIYLAGIVAFGSYFFKGTHTLEGFTLGKRSIPGWALGLSILGTYLSSNTYLGNAGRTYATNWNYFVFTLTIPIACYVSSRIFIPLYRSKLQTTAYEHLEHRFGAWARLYSGGSLILLQVARIATVLYLVGLLMQELLGWSIQGLPAILILLGGLTLLYTVIGGLEGVVWTDAVQSIILVGSAMLAVVVIVAGIDGGLGGLVSTASDAGKFGLGKFEEVSADGTVALVGTGFLTVFVYGLVENLKNFGVDQNYVQRFLAAKSDREARKSLWLGGMAYMPVSAVLFFVGTALWVYYGQRELPANFPVRDGKVLADKVFPYFIVHVLPDGVTGVVIAGVLAAAMSTLTSSINAGATVWTIDFHKRLIAPGADDRTLLRATRIATVVVGSVGTGASLLMIKAQSALQAWWTLSGVFGGGMLGLFLLGAFVKNSSARGALLGVVAGVVGIGWGTFCRDKTQWGALAFPFDPILIGFVGTIAMLVVGTAEAFVSRSRTPPVS